MSGRKFDEVPLPSRNAERRPGQEAASALANQFSLIVAIATDNLRDAAETYARAGWPVFPLRPKAKTPAIPRSEGGRGFKDATAEAGQVQRWWSRWPSANIGMPTGLLFDVLDVDVKASGSGWGSLERLRRAGHLTGCVGIARTRNGGLHLFFPASGEHSRALPYLDFKATGGYVVLPPSLVPGDLDGSSGQYEWQEPPSGQPGSPLVWSKIVKTLTPDRPRTPVPQLRPGSGRSRVDGLARVVARAAEGERNNKLFWALCTALHAGVDCQQILDAARSVGLTPTEIEATLGSAERRAAAGAR